MFFRCIPIVCSFLLFSSCIACFAQAYPQPGGGFIKSLKARGADSILFFSRTIGRMGVTEDSFYHCHDIDYMLWKMKGKTCIQKFSSCFDVRGDGSTVIELESSPVCIDSSIVHNYIGANFRSITHSTIFPLIIKRSYQGREYYHNISPSHPTIYYLYMYLKDTVIKLEVNEDDVRKDYSWHYEDGSVREYIENANYDWNASTCLWKLMELTERLVNLLEEKKLFIYKPRSR
jgi:hypothetical protein